MHATALYISPSPYRSTPNNFFNLSIFHDLLPPLPPYKPSPFLQNLHRFLWRTGSESILSDETFRVSVAERIRIHFTSWAAASPSLPPRPPPPPPTAIVIAADGSLAEHSVPVTASKALGVDHLTRFLCSSDSLSFDSFVPPLDPHDLLEEDQIYFALPKSKLGRPLTGEDMAALAVKASAAMALASRRSGRRRREIRVSPAPAANEATAARMAGQRSTKGKIGRRSASTWAKAVRRSLRRTLSMIEEGDEC